MPLKEQPLATFFGDDTFPVEWSSETERDLFWVFDDLHCPQPLSPMYEDIGGWWLTCDHMFRRFGTPFASDWIAKNINGYVYTAAVPANETTPSAGARTSAPVAEPRSRPRCCPAAYGCARSNENGRRTGPSTGHVQACAADTGRTSAPSARTAIRRST